MAQAIKFFEENSGLNKNAIEKAILDILGKQNGLIQVPSAEKGIAENLDEKLRESINNSLEIFKGYS